MAGTRQLAGAGVVSGRRGRPFNDEMHDSAAELDALAHVPPLRAALEEIDDELVDAFDHLDRRALRNQQRHRLVVILAALSGWLTFLASQAQAAFERLGRADVPGWRALARWAGAAELTLLVLTAVVVVAGVALVWHEHWLLDRFKAEQLRLLKFRALLDPRLWSPERTTWSDWLDALQHQRNAILGLGRRDLKSCSEAGDVPRLPTRDDCRYLGADAAQTLVDYYRRKRLDLQVAYYDRAARQTTRWLDRPSLMPLIFFVSIGLVALHRAVDMLAGGARSGERSLIVTGTVLLALSAVLPMAGAAVRTWRSASEYSRNAARSAARRATLVGVGALLVRTRGAECEQVLGSLQLCELVLESDQREWLRLMREINWYG